MQAQNQKCVAYALEKWGDDMAPPFHDGRWGDEDLMSPFQSHDFCPGSCLLIVQYLKENGTKVGGRFTEWRKLCQAFIEGLVSAKDVPVGKATWLPVVKVLKMMMGEHQASVATAMEEKGGADKKKKARKPASAPFSVGGSVFAFHMDFWVTHCTTGECTEEALEVFTLLWSQCKNPEQLQDFRVPNDIPDDDDRLHPLPLERASPLCVALLFKGTTPAMVKVLTSRVQLKSGALDRIGASAAYQVSAFRHRFRLASELPKHLKESFSPLQLLVNPKVDWNKSPHWEDIVCTLLEAGADPNFVPVDLTNETTVPPAPFVMLMQHHPQALSDRLLSCLVRDARSQIADPQVSSILDAAARLAAIRAARK